MSDVVHQRHVGKIFVGTVGDALAEVVDDGRRVSQHSGWAAGVSRPFAHGGIQASGGGLEGLDFRDFLRAETEVGGALDALELGRGAQADDRGSHLRTA